MFNNFSKSYITVTVLSLLFLINTAMASLIDKNIGKKEFKPGFRVRFYKPSFDGTQTDDEMKTYLKNKDYETDAELLGQMNGVTSTEFKYLRGHIDFVNGFYIDQSIDQFIVEYRGYLAPSIGGKLGLSWLENDVEICPGIKLPRHAWAYVQIYNDVFLNDTADQTVCNWETSNRDGGRDIYSGYMNVGSSGNMNLDKMYAHQLYPFRLVFYNSEESLEARFQYYDVATFEKYTLTEEYSFYSPNDNYEYRDANANSGWPRICPTFDVTDTLTPTPQPPFVTQPYTCPASSTSEVSVSTSESSMISSNRPPTTSSEMSSATSAIPDLSSSELPIVSSEVLTMWTLVYSALLWCSPCPLPLPPLSVDSYVFYRLTVIRFYYEVNSEHRSERTSNVPSVLFSCNTSMTSFRMIDAAIEAFVDKRQPITNLCINKKYVKIYIIIYVIYIEGYRIRY